MPVQESESLAENGATSTFDIADIVNNNETELLDIVISDETVTQEDLGAKEARILPNSPLHGIKKFGRNLKEFFTFDPVRKELQRLDNANQQLAEIKQFIEESGGVENVDQEILTEALTDYKERMGKIQEHSEVLREELNNQPKAVDGFLDELTNQQFNQQQVLNTIAQEVIEFKAEVASEGNEEIGQAVEAVLAEVEDTKDAVLESFTGTLVAVEDTPENVADRLTGIMEQRASEKSEFYDLRNLEILEAVADSVPENAQDAIAHAKQNTLNRFESRIRELPVVVRAEKFEQYVTQTSADETRLMSLLDDIKHADIPPDVLAKIEEAKEIAVRRFEEKLALFETRAVEDRFFRYFDPQDMGDMVAMREFKNRMGGDTEAFQIMDEMHNRSIQEFKARFNNPDSEAQADRFAELSRQAAENPSPKIFALLEELKTEVMNDPEKREFLQSMEDNLKRRFEGEFRIQGPQYFDRLTSLDPNDFASLEHLGFDPAFVDQYASRNAEHFKDYMQDVQQPDDFYNFQGRFFDMPEFVIDEINENADYFQGAMMYKARKIEEFQAEKEREMAFARLDYQERETMHQFDRAERLKEDQFWNEFHQIDWENFNERKMRLEDKLENDLAFVEEQFSERNRLFNERLQLDPWCDAFCAEQQRMAMKQEFRHRTEDIADQLMFELNRINVEHVQFDRDNPLAGVCDTPRSCEQYCREHANDQGCEWILTEKFCPSPGYFDPGFGDCVFPDEGKGYIDCPQGEFYNGYSCIRDPYWKPPERFKDCPWGTHWNEQGGFCEPDFGPEPHPPGPMPPGPFPGPEPFPPGPGPDPDPFPRPYCPPNAYFDEGAGYCLPSCPPGHYFDDYAGRCVQDLKCPEGSTPDFFAGKCRQNCGPGEYFDFFENRCKQDRWQECGPGAYWDPKTERCEKEYFACPAVYPRTCGPNEKPLQPDPYDPCGQPSCVPEFHECIDLAVVDPFPCEEGYYREIVRDPYGCEVFGECISSANPPYPPRDCGPDMYWNDAQSECVSECTDEWAPVCGTDNYGYSNECHAKRAGVGIQYYGECGPKTNECPYGQFWAFQIDRCIDDRDYISNVSGQCEYGWTWNPVGYCDQDENVVSECKSYCDPACSGSQYCQYDQFGCATECAESSTTGGETCGYNNTCAQGDYCADFEKGWCCPNGTTICSDGSCVWNTSECSSVSGYCGDGVCNNGETADWCSSDCGETSTGDACDDLFDLLPGCHIMPESSHVRFDDSMQKYVEVGTRVVIYCLDQFIPGCTSVQPIICPDNGFNQLGTISCNYSACPSGCNWDAQGCPSGCYDSTTSSGYCGDGLCNNGETQSSCYSDCNYSGSTCNYNGTCEQGETYEGCASDCPSGLNTCGNGMCEPGEDTGNCSSDCDYTSGEGCGSKNDQVSCEAVTNCYWYVDSSTSYCYYQSYACDYDGICESGEDAVQCGDCSSSGTLCPSNQYNAYGTGTYDCDWGVCTSGCQFDSQNCATGCLSSTGSGYCGDGTCDSNEDSSNCASDCSASSSDSCPSFAYSRYNSSGNHYCQLNSERRCDSNPASYITNDGSYTEANCPSSTASEGYCGNYVCESGEQTSCPGDCGGGSASDCSTSPYTCTTESDCTSYGYFWCDNECWGTQSSCDAATAGYCGDGTCNSSESSDSCSVDCGGGSGSACNYNGICDSGETPAICPGDCGGTSCSPNAYNYYTSGYTCDTSVCPDGCDYDGSGCPVSCSTSNASGFCGDGTCDSWESSSSCWSDCGDGGSNGGGDCASDYNYCYSEVDCSANGYGWCNGYCWSSYESSSCNSSYEDGSSNSGWCGDGTCDSWEDGSSCASDCGSVQGAATHASYREGPLSVIGVFTDILDYLF